jgi:hypothetical protein
MARVKAPTRANMVWRISEEKPMGEWVAAGVPASARPSQGDLSQVARGSWVSSSYDLLNGTDIVEGDDTASGDLIYEFFEIELSSVKPAKE